MRHPSLNSETWISYFALLATTMGAALRKDSRMQIIKATGLNRKSGGPGPPTHSLELAFDFRTEESWAFDPPKAMKNGSCSATIVHGGITLPFVISTGADPDFLLRSASNVHSCALLRESRMQSINATGLDRKSGGA
jgi:hypothetical protein